MVRDKKGYNLIYALREAGYDGLQLAKKTKEIGGKTEAAYFFMVGSRSRNAFHPGLDIRMALDEADMQQIAEVARKKGYLTFIDTDFNYMSNAGEFMEYGHQEVGFVFYPSHIIGRVKRMVSKAGTEVVELAPFLQGDAAYLKLWQDLKQAQHALLEATKFALKDKDGEMQENSFAPLCTAISTIRTDCYDFRKAIGIPDKSGAVLSSKQAAAVAVIAELYDTAIKSRNLM